MPRRLVAFFVASVLLWSGFSTIEAPRGAAPPAQPVQAQLQATAAVLAATPAPAPNPAAPAGSVEHHHLDDLPVQAPSDLPADTPGLLPLPPLFKTPLLLTSRPLACAAAGVGPPFLAGPLRPPCSATVMG